MKAIASQPVDFDPIHLNIVIESQAELDVVVYALSRDLLPAFKVSKRQGDALNTIMDALHTYI